mmetsp:Transcript_69147/g.193246  ORF Transcript_69147/g.193246 Transcript_69147/m.193246 type:complete len:219 (-) Transcript_69147:2543-3199(-)
MYLFTSWKKRVESVFAKCSLIVLCTSKLPPSRKSMATHSLIASSTRALSMPTAIRSRHRVVAPYLFSTRTICSDASSCSSPPSSSRSSMVMPQAFSIMARNSWMIQTVVVVQSGSSFFVFGSTTIRERACSTSLCTSGSKRRSASTGSRIVGRLSKTSSTSRVRSSSTSSAKSPSASFSLREKISRLCTSSSDSVMFFLSESVSSSIKLGISPALAKL